MSPRDYGHEGALPRFSLDRRVTVLVLFLTLMVIGTVATLGIPAELMPSGFEFPFLAVIVPYPDAPPTEVLEKVVQPLEDELSTVRGLDTLITYSFHGSARAFLKLKQGTDVDIAYREIRDRIERARAHFPAEIDEVLIRKHNTSDIPVMVVGVAVDATVTDPYNLIQDEIVKPLSRVEGVAQVQLDGMNEKEILIELDRDKTAAAGLDIYRIAQDLATDNFTLASGQVYEGPRKLLLRSIARYDSIDAIRGRRLSDSVILGDVARVRYEEAERQYVVRALGQPAVALDIFKDGDANGSEVARTLGRKLDEMRARPALRNVSLITFLDQDEIISESLTKLVRSGLVGGLLAAAVMFLFLRRFRMTVILSLSIPLSLVIGLTVMYFAGETLNILTLLGLMLSVGLLVDNSVVVAENIHRMRREGLDRREACVRGAGEVALAIVMSTLTTIVVFLPVALVEGPAQFFLMRMALPVSVSLAGSLVVALVFIPLCVYLTMSDDAVPGRGRAGLLGAVRGRIVDQTTRVYEMVFGRLNAAYGSMLGFFLQRRIDLVLVLVLVFGGSMALTTQFVEVVDNQEGEEPGFRIEVEMPPATTLDESAAFFEKADEIVGSMSEDLGLAGWFHVAEKTNGRMQGWFHSPRTVEITGKEATKRVVEALPHPPGYKFYTGDEDDLEEGDRDTFMVTLYGDDVDALEDASRLVEDRLLTVDGVLGLKRGADAPPAELGLVVDRERARRYGVNPRVIAGVVGYALRGMALPEYYEDGKEIPVRVRFQEQDREGLVELASFGVPTEAGGSLPLSALTDTKFLDSRPYIRRVDKRALQRVTVELADSDDTTAIQERLSRAARAIELPEGITIGANAGLINLTDDWEGLKFAAMLAVVFVFLLMAFLFESLMLPLSILLTIPLSILGVYWAHFLTGKDLDFLGVVGMVLLVGVVVNNGIVFIDYTHRLRSERHPRREALRLAAERRFRPIMMTAITTIGGMIPLAVAGSSESSGLGLSYTSFALTLIGGMVTATLLTLLVVPVFYTLFEDARDACVDGLRRVLARPAKAPDGEAAARS